MPSIIIPVYNEEKIMAENTDNLIKYLAGLEGRFEVLIVSNGSTDKTNEIGRSLENRHPGIVRFISLPERGVGIAFKKGVEAAKHNLLITQDMDLSTDLGFIDEALKKGALHEIIIGSKKVGAQHRSTYRLLLSTVFILMVKVLLGLGYSDYSIGAKAYKKKAILKWIDRIDQGSSYVIELIYLAKKEGLRIIEIPVQCMDRRKSRFNLVHEATYRFKKLIELFLKERVL